MEYFLFIAQSNSLALWLNAIYTCNSDAMDSNCFLCNKKKERKEEKKEGKRKQRKERRQKGTSNLNKAIEIGARIENKTQEKFA